jgi:hypothetical protein
LKEKSFDQTPFFVIGLYYVLEWNETEKSYDFVASGWQNFKKNYEENLFDEFCIIKYFVEKRN